MPTPVARHNAILAALIPVQRILPAALAAILEKAPLSPEKVAFAWRSAVGPAIDKVSTVELRNRVLYVNVRDARWQREIEHSAGIIRARLQSMLGEGVVKSISVSAP
jgi:hypothetical protein